MNLTIYCDGGSRGNPGPAASAFVATNENGQVVHEEGFFLGINTNNVAEYTALLKSFEWLVSQKEILSSMESLTCVFDSELLVKQVTGAYKIKAPHLLDLVIRIRTLEKALPIKPVYQHVLRDKNVDADLLVNQTLDSHQ